MLYILKEYKDLVTPNIVGANYSSTTGWVRKALNLESLESRVAKFNTCRFITYFPVIGGVSAGRFAVAI